MTHGAANAANRPSGDAPNDPNAPAGTWAYSDGAPDDPNRTNVLGYQSSSTSSSTATGTSSESQVRVAGVEIRRSNVDANGNGISSETDIASASASTSSATGRNADGQLTGGSVNGQASAAVARGSVTGSAGVGDLRGTGTGEGTVLSAGAEAHGLVGNDGQRSGIAFGGKAEAALASAGATGKVSIPIPFTNRSIEVETTVGASAGAIGAGGSFEATTDNKTGRSTLGVGGSLALLFGLNADAKVSYGPRR